LVEAAAKAATACLLGGIDQLDLSDARGSDVICAMRRSSAEAAGRIVLMASRALARVARSPADYAKVYGRILQGVREPVIIHWLGDMFDPALAGYWGSADAGSAMTTAVEIINEHAAKVGGVKISLLDKDKEIAMRRRLQQGVLMYTGDDFNYAELIAGDSQGYSHALLGIFDVIAPAASAALVRLAANDNDRFHEILAPTVPLSRHIFRSPLAFTKPASCSWPFAIDHLPWRLKARSMHWRDIFRFADGAGLWRSGLGRADADGAGARGIEA
jgi:hypothetical protein